VLTTDYQVMRTKLLLVLVMPLFYLLNSAWAAPSVGKKNTLLDSRLTRLRSEEPQVLVSRSKSGAELLHLNVIVHNRGATIARGVQIHVHTASLAYPLRGPTKLPVGARALYTLRGKALIEPKKRINIVAMCENCYR